MWSIEPMVLGLAGCNGAGVFESILELADKNMSQLRRISASAGGRFAAVGRLRGTGPGVSFSKAIGILEEEHPIDLVSPFEGSDRIGGAAWVGSELLSQADNRGIAKLRWGAHADDLPMHTHTGSDRFIIVLEGRGFFHVSNQKLGQFDGSDVRTIAARRLDVFAFSRDVVHTFSTDDEPMTLLSCHLPFVPLDAPDQFELPRTRWTAGEHLDRSTCGVVAVGWSSLVG